MKARQTCPNIVNSGKVKITITNNDGVEIDHINTCQHIIERFVDGKICNTRTTDRVRYWFHHNFYNWVRRGAIDITDDMMNPEKFQEMFFVSLREYLTALVSLKSNNISMQTALAIFPEFAQGAIDDVVVFSAGRMFRILKLTNVISNVHDFLLANAQAGYAESVICPLAFQVRDISKLHFPEALKRSIAWHEYTEQQAEIVDAALAQEMIDNLKDGTDFKVIDDEYETITVVQLLTQESARVEGTLLKHCVASYGSDIEKGKTIIYSARNKLMVPIATIELVNGNATQVKGKHGSTIVTKHHDDIRKYFKNHKISVSETRHFGGMKEHIDNDS